MGRQFYIERLRVSAAINNLCTIHAGNWKFGDPESGGNGLGVRTYTFGLFFDPKSVFEFNTQKLLSGIEHNMNMFRINLEVQLRCFSTVHQSRSSLRSFFTMKKSLVIDSQA